MQNKAEAQPAWLQLAAGLTELGKNDIDNNNKQGQSCGNLSGV